MNKGVFTLQKIQLFVPQSGSAVGVRQFVETKLRDFATKYSNVAFNIVYSKDRFAHPRVNGTFLNGRTQTIVLRNKDCAQVEMLLKRLHDRKGGIMSMKRWPSAQTTAPSFQGKWSQDAVTQFPYQV